VLFPTFLTSDDRIFGKQQPGIVQHLLKMTQIPVSGMLANVVHKIREFGKNDGFSVNGCAGVTLYCSFC
jgi:hypothetical protein